MLRWAENKRLRSFDSKAFRHRVMLILIKYWYNISLFLGVDLEMEIVMRVVASTIGRI